MSELDFYAVYEKKGRAKYVSHLDMVRLFNRAFRRAGIPVAYSEGFNPHPKISFALPLPVFYESVCEMLIFSLQRDMNEGEIVSRFNAVMPEGIAVTSVVRGKPRVKSLEFARYRVLCPLPDFEQIEKFLALPEIVIEKKTKSGIKDTDIKEDIKSIDLCASSLSMVLAAGSRANLKPDVVLRAMEKYIQGYSAPSAEFLREEILDADLAAI